MKRCLFLCSLFFVTAGALLAQEVTQPAQQDPKAAEKIQNLRIAYISEKLGLTPAQAEKFWPVYREFVQKRSAMRQELKSFQRGMDANKPDPQKQKELLDLGLNTKQKEIDLEKDYSRRLLNIINTQQMLNLRNAEKDFRTMIINLMQQRRLMQERKENFRDQNQRLRQKAN